MIQSLIKSHRFALSICVPLFVFAFAANAGEPFKTADLWPNKAPGEKADRGPEADTTKDTDPLVAAKRVIRLGNISHPTLTIYRPDPAKDGGAAVIVCPGGGYHILALDLEGTEICDWLNSIGVTAVLLKYRVPGREPAIQDGQRAVSLVRYNATDWKLDPHKIGILGFSAGGNLCAAVSTHFAERTYPKVDASDEVSCRPDFAALIYPAVKAFPEFTVTSNTPPIFLTIAVDDPTIKVDDVMAYAGVLRQAGVPFELHVYPTGGHGFGLRPTKDYITTWPARATDWMRSLGVLSAP